MPWPRLLAPGFHNPWMRVPPEDVKACGEVALGWLKQRPGLYVTPGWVWDRGTGEHSEHTISMALKALVKARRIDCRAAYGIPVYAWCENLADILAERDKEEAKRNKP